MEERGCSPGFNQRSLLRTSALRGTKALVERSLRQTPAAEEKGADPFWFRLIANATLRQA